MVVLLNLAVGKLWPKIALSPTELVVIYVILSTASAVGGQGMIAVLFGGLGHAFHFATPENEWRELLHSHLPNWLVVRDARALKTAYGGESTLYLAEHIRMWITPVLGWAFFLLTLVIDVSESVLLPYREGFQQISLICCVFTRLIVDIVQNISGVSKSSVSKSTSERHFPHFMGLY